MNINREKFKKYIPWIIVYMVILTIAFILGARMYKKYQNYRLPSGKIELTVSKTRYQLGEPIEFIVTNNFSVPIFVTNNCPKEPLDVYEWRDGKWTELHDTAKDNSECYSEERNVEIQGGEARGYTFKDWPELFSKPGVYRIATKIDHYDDILFQDFVILEPAKTIEIKLPATSSNDKIVAPSPIPKTQIYIEKNQDEDADYEREYDDHEDEDDD